MAVVCADLNSPAVALRGCQSFMRVRSATVAVVFQMWGFGGTLAAPNEPNSIASLAWTSPQIVGAPNEGHNGL